MDIMNENPARAAPAIDQFLRCTFIAPLTSYYQTFDLCVPLRRHGSFTSVGLSACFFVHICVGSTMFQSLSRPIEL